jgi:hypothetical protein
MRNVRPMNTMVAEVENGITRDETGAFTLASPRPVERITMDGYPGKVGSVGEHRRPANPGQV